MSLRASRQLRNIQQSWGPEGGPSVEAGERICECPLCVALAALRASKEDRLVLRLCIQKETSRCAVSAAVKCLFSASLYEASRGPLRPRRHRRALALRPWCPRSPPQHCICLRAPRGPEGPLKPRPPEAPSNPREGTAQSPAAAVGHQGPLLGLPQPQRLPTCVSLARMLPLCSRAFK